MERQRAFQKQIISIGLFLVVCLLMGIQKFPKAVYASEHEYVSSKLIGNLYTAEENGLSASGVRMELNDRVLMYGFDVWRYSQSAGWKFDYQNLQGLWHDTPQEQTLPEGYIIKILNPSEYMGRFWIYGEYAHRQVRKYPCYSIETTRYQKGKILSKEYEYSTDSKANWLNSSYSLMLAINLKRDYIVGSYSPDQISYYYSIHSGIFIGEDGDASLSAEGGTVLGRGEAYKDVNDKYSIRKLPQAVRPRDKNVYAFDGWYTSPEGGERVYEGDYIAEGDTLYAHWTAIPQKCDVKCIDILKHSSGLQEVLGENKWQAEYGDMTSGAVAGCTSGSGIYYPGREYTGCSQAVVEAEGTTVYRYFQNSQRDVVCVDMVHVGPDTGQQLGNHMWKAEYSSTTSGGVIGCDRTVGTYYEGYRYMYSSMKQVGDDGCMVYRYFTPIIYNIEFISNCDSGGQMSSLRNLYYGHDYRLTVNSFINRKKIAFHTNAEDAVCDTSSQMVYSEFAGWASTATGGVIYSDGSLVNGLTSEEKTVSLYAVWSDKEVIVSVQPKRPGYEFSGWSEDTEDISGKNQFHVNRDLNLYAVWKAAPVTYHVEYYKQKINQGYELSNRYDFYANTGSVASTGAIRNLFPGFILDEASSKLSGVVKADGTLILNAYFQRGQYTVKFNVNGGRLLSDEKVLKPITGLFEQSVILPKADIYRAGYIFSGWTTEPDGKIVSGKPGLDYLIPNHDLTLYACWTPREDTRYRITPYYENLNGAGYMRGREMEMEGTTDLSVLDELLKKYSVTDVNDSIKQLFGKGYRILDDEILKKTIIRVNADINVDIYLQREKYEYNFYIMNGAEKQIITTQNVVYGQKYIMPEMFQNVNNISGYQRGDGTVLLPGEQVDVEGDGDFLVFDQHTDIPEVVRTGKPVPSQIPDRTKQPEQTMKTERPLESAATNATHKPVETRKPENPSKPGNSQKPGINKPSPVLSSSPETTLPPQMPSKTPGVNNPFPVLSASPDNNSSFPENFPDLSGSTEEPGQGVTVTSQPVPSNKAPMTQTPLPVRIPEQKNQTPSPVKTPEQKNSANTQDQVHAASEPNQTAVPSALSTDGMSVISTWVGADSDEIASKLAATAREAFLKKGTKVQKKGILYLVTQSSPKTRTVSAIGIVKQKKNIKIPDQIQMRGYYYQVTKIQKNAFSHQKKLKKVTIGKNIKQIGKKAFYGSRKLKKIVFESSQIARIETGAWRGCSKGLRLSFHKNCNRTARKYILKQSRGM